MGHQSYSRRTADVLRRTIEQLEADPTIDTQDPSFVNLKCALLNRILQAENGAVHAESRIHLVRSQAAAQQVEEADDESDSSAIA